jgi:paraquat-inducible protein B
MRWPFPIVWLVPILAAGLAVYYFYGRAQERGEKIIVLFDDASGLKPGQTPVDYRGAQVGEVSKLYLSDDRSQVKVEIRIQNPVKDIAREGAQFWIERPEFSAGNISGLSTVFSGPFIQVIPGSGAPATQFVGLTKAPVTTEQNGLHLILHTAQSPSLAPDSPVYYRGIRVGVVDYVRLAADATQVDVSVVIHARYAPLVHLYSKFWSVSGADLKGGIFTGISLKVESIRALISGGVAFATPDQNPGPPADQGQEFDLAAQPNKEWLTWSPKISISTSNPDKPQGHLEKSGTGMEKIIQK